MEQGSGEKGAGSRGGGRGVSPSPPSPSLPPREGTSMTRKPFELRVEPGKATDGLALYRLSGRSEEHRDGDRGIS